MRRVWWTGYAAGLLLVLTASIGAWLARVLLGDVNISLIYLVVVVAVAAMWGLRPALAASVMAAAALDQFFLDSFGARSIANTDDWLTVVLFLLIAALTGRLAAGARERAAESRRRERATAVLYNLSTALLGESDLATILPPLTQRVTETFGLAACHVALPDEGRHLRVVAGCGRWDDADRADAQVLLHQVARDGRPTTVRESTPPSPGIDAAGRGSALYLPLVTTGAGVGVMRVARAGRRPFAPDEEHLLVTFVQQAALAIEKASLAERARRVTTLEETDRLKTVLLSSVSHDLRSPLTAIKAAVTGLLAYGDDMERQERRELLGAIDGEADRLSRLVANLLDLSRIQGDALRPRRDWVDVAEILVAVADRLGPRIPQRMVVMTPDDLLLVQADSVRLDQVVSNLVENAATYAPPDTTIHIAARREGDAAVIRVRDEGPGIPPEERERVFEPFYRGVDAEQARPGSGLGLAICKGIVEAHGGRISVEPAVGNGACVTMTLPGAADVEGVKTAPAIAGGALP